MDASGAGAEAAAGRLTTAWAGETCGIPIAGLRGGAMVGRVPLVMV
ncbi:hypothetical protein [Rhodovastum atsumiense]|nr:hypothetical protein [Rhodovastum atsumiense]